MRSRIKSQRRNASAKDVESIAGLVGSLVQAGLHEREFFPGEAGLLGTGILSNFAITVDAPVRA